MKVEHTVDPDTRAAMERLERTITGLAAVFERMADAVEANNALRDVELNGPRG